MRRRTNRRGGGGGWHWALVAACLALTALPAGARERIRGKLLDLQVKLGQGWGIMRDVPPPPRTHESPDKSSLQLRASDRHFSIGVTVSFVNPQADTALMGLSRASSKAEPCHIRLLLDP